MRDAIAYRNSKRERYRKDAEYRDRAIASMKRSKAKLEAIPEYCKLEKVRKRICATRLSIERLMEIVGHRERLLFRLIKRRDEMAAEFRQKHKRCACGRSKVSSAAVCSKCKCKQSVKRCACGGFKKSQRAECKKCERKRIKAAMVCACGGTKRAKSEACWRCKRARQVAEVGEERG